MLFPSIVEMVFDIHAVVATYYCDQVRAQKLCSAEYNYACMQSTIILLL